MKVTKVGKMPLNVEHFFHRNLLPSEVGSPNILRSFQMESQMAMRRDVHALIQSPLTVKHREVMNFRRIGSSDFPFLKEYELCGRSQKLRAPSQQTIRW